MSRPSLQHPPLQTLVWGIHESASVEFLLVFRVNYKNANLHHLQNKFEKLFKTSQNMTNLSQLSVALNCILQIHKKIDRIPPAARDPGILEFHIQKTLLTWG